MKKSIIWIGIIAVIAIWGISAYNGLVNKDESVTAAWGQVENTYQRRADLIPNLVATVKGYAEHERMLPYSHTTLKKDKNRLAKQTDGYYQVVDSTLIKVDFKLGKI